MLFRLLHRHFRLEDAYGATEILGALNAFLLEGRGQNTQPAGPTEFSPEELMLLRCVGDGIEVRELIAAAGPRWVSAQRPFFSLLQRQFLTLLGRHAMPASAWAPVLAQPERPDSAEPSAPIF